MGSVMNVVLRCGAHIHREPIKIINLCLIISKKSQMICISSLSSRSATL
jgi:hypothetical protein